MWTRSLPSFRHSTWVCFCQPRASVFDAAIQTGNVCNDFQLTPKEFLFSLLLRTLTSLRKYLAKKNKLLLRCFSNANNRHFISRQTKSSTVITLYHIYNYYQNHIIWYYYIHVPALQHLSSQNFARQRFETATRTLTPVRRTQS